MSTPHPTDLQIGRGRVAAAEARFLVSQLKLSAVFPDLTALLATLADGFDAAAWKADCVEKAAEITGDHVTTTMAEAIVENPHYADGRVVGVKANLLVELARGYLSGQS